MMPYVHVLWTNLAFGFVYGLLNWHGMEVLHLPYPVVWCYIQIVSAAQAVGYYWYGNYRDKKSRQS